MVLRITNYWVHIISLYSMLCCFVKEIQFFSSGFPFVATTRLYNGQFPLIVAWGIHSVFFFLLILFSRFSFVFVVFLFVLKLIQLIFSVIGCRNQLFFALLCIFFESLKFFHLHKHIIIILFLWEFFIPALADGLPREFE